MTPASQTSVEDVQAGNIEVKGSVTLDAPGGSVDTGPGIVMVREGANYVIEWSKFGAVNNVLYWSLAGQSNSWDLLNSYAIMDREVTGLASCSNGLTIWLGGTAVPGLVQTSGSYTATIVLTVAYTGN